MEKSFALLASFIAGLLVLLPFFKGKGGILAAASAVNDEMSLSDAKKKLAKRWAKDEEAFKKGDISQREWDMRRELLTNRFLDVARRLDFLRGNK